MSHAPPAVVRLSGQMSNEFDWCMCQMTCYVIRGEPDGNLFQMRSRSEMQSIKGSCSSKQPIPASVAGRRSRCISPGKDFPIFGGCTSRVRTEQLVFTDMDYVQQRSHKHTWSTCDNTSRAKSNYLRQESTVHKQCLVHSCKSLRASSICLHNRHLSLSGSF